jgi:hypothetical protein
MGKKTMLLRDEDELEDFFRWMIDEVHLKESTAEEYRSYVRSINKSFSIRHNDSKTNLRDLLRIYIETGNSFRADELIDKVFYELCRKGINRAFNIKIDTIQNWRSGFSQFREFINQSIEESDYPTDEVESVGDLPCSPQTGSYVFKKDDLNENFTFRLITQNRPNRDICFPISTIKTLFYRNSEKKFFDEWIEKQIDNITVITEDAEFSVSEVTSIKVLEDGSVKIEIKGQRKPFDLYSNKADNSKKFKVSVKKFSQVVLDHVKPMRELLDENKAHLPVLRDITKRIYKADSSITTGKELRKVASKLLREGKINKDDISGLKEELKWIQIQLQLMDAVENAKKSDK